MNNKLFAKSVNKKNLIYTMSTYIKKDVKTVYNI